jgi:hypothetical protein
MTEDLKPCPFCNGEASIERYGDRRQSTIYACDVCGCRLETGEEWNHGAAWNRRPASPGREEVARVIFDKIALIDACGQLCVDGDSIDRAADAILALLAKASPSTPAQTAGDNREDDR